MIALRKQLFVTACLAAVLVTAVVYSANTQLNRGFATIETDEARHGIDRARRALDADLSQLAVTTADYAHWGELYRHVRQDPRGSYDLFFTPDNMRELRIDFVWLADKGASDLLARQFGTGVPATSTALDSETTQRLRLYRAEHPARAAGSAPQLLELPGGPAAVSAGLITSQSSADPALGTLIFGRYLNESVVGRLEALTQSPIRLTPIDRDRSTQGELPEVVARWLSAAASHEARTADGTGEDGHDLLVEAEDPAMLSGHVLLRDVDGRALVLLSTTVSRNGLLLGKHIITWTVAALLFSFALVMSVLISQLNRSWRARAAAQRQWLDHERKLARLALLDALTGLPNAARLQRIFPRLLKRAGREGWHLAVLYLNLDGLKQFNDTLGREGGDRVLRATAVRLRQGVAGRGFVAHMGGDEFIILAKGLADRRALDAFVNAIQAVVAAPLALDVASAHLSSSIGIALYPDHGLNAELLLKHADIALSYAKDSGRATHQVYTPEMSTALRERLDLERGLRRALAAGELDVEYQPCFDLRTLRPVSFEALVRWRTADGGLIPPSQFIPLAEQSKLIFEVGEFVLRAVCRQLREWQRDQLPLLPVSVNVSPRQFGQLDFAGLVTTLARNFEIPAHLLHFEITETAAMQDSEETLACLRKLRDLGSHVLIDDFGTDYSNLRYLKRLPIDTLKIDQTFVRGLASDPNDAAIVRAIVDVATSLGLTLVAEGIEFAEQLESLRALGCQFGQGFLLGRPSPAGACRVILRQLSEVHDAPVLQLANRSE